jgi:transposase-like protein
VYNESTIFDVRVSLGRVPLKSCLSYLYFTLVLVSSQEPHELRLFPIEKENSFVSAKRLTPEQREAIIKDIKARKLTFRRIAHKHQVSSATVSTLAEREGLRRPRKTTPKTTPATPAPDNSYDRAQRISALDRMLNSIDKMIEKGGLSTSQLKDLAGAAQSVYSTRRAEDIEPDPEEKKQDTTVWLEEFATPGESRGIGLDLNTEVGRRMYAFGLAMETEDIDDYQGLKKREQEIMDEMNARAKAEAEGHDDG